MKCMICKHGETQKGFTTVTLKKSGVHVDIREYSQSAA